MARKQFEQLLDAFQGNAYPAMLDDLAEHLGVTADSIRRIAPGWVPIVPFVDRKTKKPKPSFIGWWSIPERDAEGTPVGLALRSQNDLKVMYPGSKHGLVYEVNPNHEKGGQGYEAGPQNWIRTSNDMPCIMCGKPDGCIHSSENPADPKAVICRVKKSDRPMRFGYLHIRKAEGEIRRNASALGGDPADWVIVVEGFSDTCAAMDLGFTAVGKPSNLAGMDELANLVRGRRVVVMGENDLKPDGQFPGKEGMIATFQVLRKVCADIKMLMPLDHIKDLRAWKVKYDLTREQLLEQIETKAQEFSIQTVLPDSRPLTIARAYMDAEHRMAGRYVLCRWAGSWYRFADAKYRKVQDEAFGGPVYKWAHDKFVQQINPNGSSSMLPLVANTTLISNIAGAVMSDVLVDSPRVPCWINGKKGPDPRDLIVFNNGILHVPTFLEGGAKYLLDLTPDLFTTAALPFPFDPTVECPTWMKFLRTSLGDEQAKIMLLREWFGYSMTPDTTHQKLMYLRGPSGAGKSVILNMLCRLVGEEQAASTSFADLSGPFGIQALLGKLVCVIPDARTPRGDNMRALELLLNIAAGDGVQINRKFKDPLERHQLTARISIASNSFLEVSDDAGAMLRRLNIIEFKNSFVGREDFDLENKLAPEIPGIALWALTGLKRLRETGRFTVPESSKAALQEWRTGTSSLASFVEECCDLGEMAEANKDELYDVWFKWCTERKLKTFTKTRFAEHIRSNAPYVVPVTHEGGNHKNSVYRGLKLKSWASRTYLGEP